MLPPSLDQTPTFSDSTRLCRFDASVEVTKAHWPTTQVGRCELSGLISKFSIRLSDFDPHHHARSAMSPT